LFDPLAIKVRRGIIVAQGIVFYRRRFTRQRQSRTFQRIRSH